MIPVASADFLKEFTIYAERAHAENQALFVQRANDKNLIVMPMDMYNDMQRQIYQLKKQQK